MGWRDGEGGSGREMEREMGGRVREEEGESMNTREEAYQCNYS